jgi:hypothetical protein
MIHSGQSPERNSTKFPTPKVVGRARADTRAEATWFLRSRNEFTVPPATIQVLDSGSIMSAIAVVDFVSQEGVVRKRI